MTKDFLVNLRASAEFQAFVKTDLVGGLPPIRPFDPSSPCESTEQWKADSLRREGYILCLQRFGLTHEHLMSGVKNDE